MFTQITYRTNLIKQIVMQPSYKSIYFQALQTLIM